MSVTAVANQKTISRPEGITATFASRVLLPPLNLRDITSFTRVRGHFGVRFVAKPSRSPLTLEHTRSVINDECRPNDVVDVLPFGYSAQMVWNKCVMLMYMF